MCSYEHLFPNVYFKYSKLVLYPYTIFPFQSHKSEATGFQSKIVLKNTSLKCVLTDVLSFFILNLTSKLQ